MPKQYRRTKKCGPARKAAKKKRAEDDKLFKELKRALVWAGIVR